MTRTLALLLLALAVLVLAFGGWAVRGVRWLVSGGPLAAARTVPAT
ncbi:MAG TPA: hypothetical protein VHF67_11215 [Gaiellaceae bacterium]|nr:hypothetical protein [Gaiellaceae bacterium]